MDITPRSPTHCVSRPQTQTGFSFPYFGLAALYTHIEAGKRRGEEGRCL
jgi:hypothetical protein